MKIMKWASPLLMCGMLVVLPSHGEIVVIVSNANGNSTLNRDDVERIFLGKLSTYPNGMTAIPLDNNGSLKDPFYQRVANKNPSQLRAYWSKMVFTSGGQPPKEVSSDTDVVEIVAKNPNTMGYVDKAHITSSVHVVYTLP